MNLKHADDENKTASFRANKKLNDLLDEFYSILKPIQEKKEKEFTDNKYPFGFIVGNPRSGTTVLLQWLSSLGYFSYPTNLLTRFAYAPYLGAMIQKLLFDPEYDFHDDFKDLRSGLNFSSSLGKSKGALAVNEFQHYFRNYMVNTDPRYLNADEMKAVDIEGIRRGLASLEAQFNKPFICKATMLQFNLKELHEAIDKAIIIHIVRDPLYVMQSIYEARIKYYGTSERWWSVMPKEYRELKEMDVSHQIAGQVFYTEKALTQLCEDLPDKNVLKVNYSDLCTNPEKVFKQLREKYRGLDYADIKEYSGTTHFDSRDVIRLDKEIIQALEKAYKEFKNAE